jgi:hypothetical protein
MGRTKTSTSRANQSTWSSVLTLILKNKWKAVGWLASSQGLALLDQFAFGVVPLATEQRGRALLFTFGTSLALGLVTWLAVVQAQARLSRLTLMWAYAGAMLLALMGTITAYFWFVSLEMKWKDARIPETESQDILQLWQPIAYGSIFSALSSFVVLAACLLISLVDFQSKAARER